MPLHLTTDGSATEIATDNGQRGNAEKAVLTTKDEWEAIAGTWPLKRLVEIWNSLPGVTPVEKFTNRQIALERIWRAVEISRTSAWKSTGERRAGQGPLSGRLQSSSGVCPALPPGRSHSEPDPEPHRMAAAQCARLPFRKRAQTGPKRPLVRAWRRTRVSGQELSFGISAILSSCLIPGVLEGAEQLFLFLPIHHPGY